MNMAGRPWWRSPTVRPTAHIDRDLVFALAAIVAALLLGGALLRFVGVALSPWLWRTLFAVVFSLIAAQVGILLVAPRKRPGG
jgi:hypothetical protein